MPSSIYLNNTAGSLQVPALGVGSTPPAAGIAFPNATVVTDSALGSLAMISSATTNRVMVPNGSNAEQGGAFWSGNQFSIGGLNNGGTARTTAVTAGGALALAPNNGSFKWIITTAGDFTANTDNANDLGASGATRPRTGYFGTSLVAPLLTAQGYLSGARSTIGTILTVTEAVTLSGATTATANIIPAGATVINIATTTTTTITGASGYQIGDGSDADRYGDITGTAIGTHSGSTDGTADPRWWTNAARAVTLTAKTSNFTGGVVQVTVFYQAAAGA